MKARKPGAVALRMARSSPLSRLDLTRFGAESNQVRDESGAAEPSQVCSIQDESSLIGSIMKSAASCRTRNRKPLTHHLLPVGRPVGEQLTGFIEAGQQCGNDISDS